MSRKKIKTDGIYFTGKSSDDVTGSQYVVKFNDCKCLLECGLYQSASNSYLDSYRTNSEKFKFKPTELDFVFVAHAHIDHCGLIPRLVREGFKGKIITTKETAMIMKPLLLNSCYILQEEAKILSKKYHRDYKPIYEEQDVYNTLELIEPCEEYNHIYVLNETVSFQWLHNSHCIGAAQLQLILNGKGQIRKVLYTSDIGSLNSNNHFVGKTEIPEVYNDIVIMESTYGNSKRLNKKTRDFDKELLKTAIETTLNRSGSVILPCFSFSRTQELLSTIYDIFNNDKFFNTPIIVDSKLSVDISKLYLDLLQKDNLLYWSKVYHWKNVRFVSEKDDSQECLADNTPKIVLSSSGFCTNGRIIKYLQKYLKDTNSMIVFSGFVGDNPSYLSYRIKNYRDHKTISINKMLIPNRADCINLSTFSSHANHNDLLKYGSSLNTNKLILVHGSTESKQCLQKALKEQISKNNKTYRVLSSFKGMIVHL